MNTFESLPHEIRDIIMLYVGDHANKTQLMTVNKKWYNYHLALVYTTPTINLNSRLSKFYGIVDSPFHPGKYTTSITFQHGLEGDMGYSADITQSKFYCLMMHTLHVKEVKFNQISKFNKRDWDYFYEALKAANTWKLHNLPDNHDFSIGYRQAELVHATYLKCAKHLKHSINSLLLIGTRQPEKMDFRSLNVFTALRSLNLTEGLLERVNDLDILLQNVPQLEELEVDFIDISFIPNSRNGGRILSREYPSIKTLKFHSFIFQTDQQVCIFYTNFTGLKKLHLTGIQNNLILRPETEMKFFTMLSSLLDYDFGLRGNLIGKSDFVSENCLQVNHALLSGRSLEYNESHVCVKKSKLFPDGAIQHIFPNDHVTARRIFLGLGPNIQQLELSDIEDGYIQDSLEALFSNQHKKLRLIVLQRLKFTMLTNANLVFTGYIDSVQFEFCTLSEQALQILLACFTNLRNVHFKACVLPDSFDDRLIYVTMPKTDIQQLCITYNVPPKFEFGIRYTNRWNRVRYRYLVKPRAPYPLVSITLINEGTTKYYYTKYETVPVVMETTEKEFLQIREDFRRYLPLSYFIAIQIKSIRELTIINNETHPSTDVHIKL